MPRLQRLAPLLALAVALVIGACGQTPGAPAVATPSAAAPTVAPAASATPEGAATATPGATDDYDPY